MPEIYGGFEEGRNPTGRTIIHGTFREGRQSHGIPDTYFHVRNPELVDWGDCSTQGMM